jgi:hypothetical protein
MRVKDRSTTRTELHATRARFAVKLLVGLLPLLLLAPLTAYGESDLGSSNSPTDQSQPTPVPLSTTPPPTQPLGEQCAEFASLLIEEGPIGRWFTPGRRNGKPTHIVLHTTESPREPGGELNVAAWLSRTDYRASTHFVIGPERSLRVVDLGDTAWGVGSVSNATGVQIELIGYASNDRDEWLTSEGRFQLCRAAALAAALSHSYDIPLRRVEAPGLLDGVSGVAGHHAFAQAFGGSTHTDPGDGFPWDSFLAQAATFLELAAVAGPLPEDVLKPDFPSGLPAGSDSSEEGSLATLSELRRIVRELDTFFDDLNIISKFGGIVQGVNGPGDPYEGFGKGDDPVAARESQR